MVWTGQVYRQDTPLEYAMNFVVEDKLTQDLIYLCIPRRGILSVEKLHPSTILHTPEGYPICINRSTQIHFFFSE
jgi:hypothetical protein